MGTIKKLNTFALTLLITGAVDSIRNLPASALFGSTLIFYFIFAAIVFLIPTALISAELSAHAEGGGIYQWGRLAFGKQAGFLAVWLQWASNIIWFPTFLSFIAGTATYFFNPALAQNKVYLISVILGLIWSLTLINLKGIRISSKFTSFCAIVGLIIPMTLIIVLLIAWLLLGHPTQIQLNLHTMIPSLHHTENWIALTAIILGFAGMELTTVHIKDVDRPQTTFPKALALSTLMILATMTLGSLAIAFVLPRDQINLVDGTIQTFSYFLTAYHLSWLTPVLTLLLVIGSLGGIISWVCSPIRGMGQAAQDGFLPAFLAKENKHHAPKNLLILQAILVSLVCLVFLLFPGVNGSYWLLSAVSTQLYMLMYVVMFISALRLRRKLNYKPNGFRIPGRSIGFWVVCLLGLMGCAMTLLVGFIPPSNIDIGSKLHYEIVTCIGLGIMILPICFFYRYARLKKNNTLMLEDNVLLEKE